MKEFIFNLLPKPLKGPALAVASFFRDPKYAWLFYHRFNGLDDQQIRYILEKQFLSATGKSINFDSPQTFNEKLQWLKLYNRNPLLTKCADKVTVRDYVKETIGPEYLVPILGTFDNPSKINFSALPNQFVLKVNWGSGQNVICKDKKTFDEAAAVRKLKLWMHPRSNHYFDFFEWCYKDITPKIIAEEYIQQLDGYLVDYKFHVFNGEPILLQFIDRWQTHRETIYHIPTWTKTDLHFTYQLLDRRFERTQTIDEMIKLCRALAKPFPYVRVDLYDIQNKIFFGELTFYPGNGELSMDDKWAKELGDLLILPKQPLQDT